MNLLLIEDEAFNSVQVLGEPAGRLEGEDTLVAWCGRHGQGVGGGVRGMGREWVEARERQDRKQGLQKAET